MSFELIKKYKIDAKKSLWQNFLVDYEKVQNIADILDIKNENIIEVWPWYGALTDKILDKKPKSLTLVEIDKNMVWILEKRIENNELNISWINFEIINTDVLKYEPKFYSHLGESDLYVEDYFVIANIPYYITSPILRHFLYEIENKPQKMVILMQKDVWDRILLWQDNSTKVKSWVLSLFIAKKCIVKEMLFVPKECFRPIPKVESSVLLFELHNNYDEIPDDIFLEFIKKSFAEPRKKLVNNLVKAWYEKEKVLKSFAKLGFEEGIRWDSLLVDNFCNLIREL